MARFLSTILLVVGLTAVSAHAQTTYYVNGGCGNDDWSGLNPVCEEPDGPKATIQAGINAAQDGDTVQVADGVYKGEGNKNIDFLGKAITVRSRNGSDNCIIDCEGAGRGFDFHSAETQTSIVQGVTITNGFADMGGGVYIKEGNPAIINCMFDSNLAGRDGGGMYAQASDATLVDCVFTNNAAHRSGGGIYSSEGGLKVTGCEFNRNTTRVLGAGVNNEDGNPILTKCSFFGNSGGESGVGGMFSRYGNPTLVSCSFVANSGRNSGGLRSTYGSPTLTECVFERNSSDFVAGGMSSEEEAPVLTACTFIENSCGHYAGGFSNFDGNPKLKDCTFVRNSSAHNAGGMYNNDGRPTLTGCTFAGNWSAHHSGGFVNGRDGIATFVDCQFVGNHSDWFPGGMSDLGGTSTHVNGLFTENTSWHWGGAMYTSGQTTLSNCLIVRNSSESFGGGITVISGHLEVTNSILWRNRPRKQIDLQGNATARVRYCCIQRGWPGEGNIDEDPLFMDGPLGEFYLSQVAAGQPEDSPCVDAGSDTAKNLGLDEYTTRTDEVGDEGIVDMGYHYPIGEGGLECGKIKGLKANCKGKPGKFKIKVIVKSNLPQGTEMTLVLDGDDRKTVKTKGSGKAKAKWKKTESGDHEVCIEECPEVCDDARCGE